MEIDQNNPKDIKNVPVASFNMWESMATFVSERKSPENNNGTFINKS